MRTDTEGEAGIDSEAADAASGSSCVASRSLLVCFSGKIGSGKTEVSTALARALACQSTSFGGYLRAQIAERGGDPECRRSLQDLGQSRIEQDTDLFCRDVLAAGGFVPGHDFVLDGVRHVAVLPHLARVAAPSEVRLIFLEAGLELRSIRAGERSGSARQDFNRAARHVVEADMEAGLPSAADAIVDGSLPVAEAVSECMVRIRNWRLAGSREVSVAGLGCNVGGYERK